MARLRGGQHRFQSPKRLVSWGLGPEQVAVSTAGTGSVIWTNGVTQTAGKSTIVRIRGNFLAQLTATAGGVTDGMVGAVGIGLVAKTAFDAGVASVPGPLNEMDWDGWMWHSFWMVSGAAAQASSIQRLVIDTKAMRKWDEEQVLFGATEFTETGVEVVATRADSRVLVKL